MVRSVLYVTPKNGDHRAIVDFYRDHRVLERAAEIEGFVASELQVPAHGDGPLLVTALWRDEQAYQRWLGSPHRTAQARDLAPLVDGSFGTATHGTVYDVVLAAGDDVRVPV